MIPRKLIATLLTFLLVLPSAGGFAESSGGSGSSVIATAIPIQTYGVLQTAFINLTLSPAYVFVEPENNAFGAGTYPIAIGMTGVIMNPAAGQQAFLPGVATPCVTQPFGKFTPASATLQPCGSYFYQGMNIQSGTTNIPVATLGWSSNANYVLQTALFPSWNSTAPLKSNNNPDNPLQSTTFYQYDSNSTNVVTTAGLVTIAGTPKATSVPAPPPTTIGMAKAGSTNINIVIPGSEPTNPNYNNFTVNINTLGLATTTTVPPNATSGDIYDTAATTVADTLAVVTCMLSVEDPLSWLGMALSLAGTIEGMCVTPAIANAGDPAFPVASNQINVTGFANLSTTAGPVTAANAGTGDSAWTLQKGDNGALLYYPTNFTGNPDENNALLLLNFRMQYTNMPSSLPSAADQLVVAIINQPLFAAIKCSSAANTSQSGSAVPPPTSLSTAAGQGQTPAVKRAQEAARLLDVFRKIAKTSMTDNARIEKLYGFKSIGTGKSANDKQQAITQLKAILAKYRSTIPEISQLNLMKAN
ncbi:MAG: hypothetical protein WCP79_08795 [Bacillota bacterium]